MAEGGGGIAGLCSGCFFFSLAIALGQRTKTPCVRAYRLHFSLFLLHGGSLGNNSDGGGSSDSSISRQLIDGMDEESSRDRC